MIDLLELLTTGQVTPRGFLAGASNHTLLVQVQRDGHLHFAVYKPRAGERPLWDFPSGTLCQRETAAFVVSDLLGWGLVPPTVLRDDAPMGPGSVQAFVPHDPERHYFALVDEGGHDDALLRMAVFDLLINNADRKGSHVMIADDGRLLGCDHGLTFHTEPKLRTVIWDLAGRPVPDALRSGAARLADGLGADGPARTRLQGLLTAAEVEALRVRADAVAALPVLPELIPERRPYPWPPL